MKNAKGFTVVELLVVVTLICIFVMATTQLTGKWVEQTRLTEAQGMLERAIGQTKALAIRNPGGVFNANAATAALCINADTIEIKSAAAGAVDCSTAGTQVWSAKLPKDVTVKKDANTTVSCLALFDRKANYSPSPNNDCANSATLTFAFRNANEPPTTFY